MIFHLFVMCVFQFLTRWQPTVGVCQIKEDRERISKGSVGFERETEAVAINRGSVILQREFIKLT